MVAQACWRVEGQGITSPVGWAEDKAGLTGLRRIRLIVGVHQRDRLAQSASIEFRIGAEHTGGRDMIHLIAVEERVVLTDDLDFMAIAIKLVAGRIHRTKQSDSAAE